MTPLDVTCHDCGAGPLAECTAPIFTGGFRFHKSRRRLAKHARALLYREMGWK